MLPRILLLFWIAFASGVVQGADSYEKPSVHVGDIWKYRVQDGFTNETKFEIEYRVVTLTDTEITTRLAWKGTPSKGLAIFDRQWNMIDDGNNKWDPLRPEFKFPIHIGDAWKQPFQVANLKNGSQFSSFISTKVEAHEKITVPAGTFYTLRIEMDIDVRATGISTSVTKHKIKIWYAPEVNRSIRQESQTFADGRMREQSITELTEYAPANKNTIAPAR